MRKISKKWRLILVAVAIFSVGVSIGITTRAIAWPFATGRWYGFFERQYDQYGPNVIDGGINPGNSGYYTVDNLVDDMARCLYNTPPRTAPRNAPGAAFIILTMLGYTQNDSAAWGGSAWGGIGLARAEFGRWETLVRSYAAQGRVNFNAYVAYTINTYHQGSPGPFDVAYYTLGTSYAWAVVFTSPSGSQYIIKHDCGNPIGDMSSMPVLADYDITGHTTVSNANPKPGDDITFRHYIKNEGPTSTNPTTVWWASWEWPSWSGTGGGPYGTMSSGQEVLVNTENYHVPIGTAPGTDICRIVGWDPDDSHGGRDGRGTPACAKVAWDFELTPTVTASTTAAQQNDSVTFTYRVSSSGLTVSKSTTCKPVGNKRSPGYTPLPQQDADRTSDVGYTPPSTSCPTTFTSGSTTTVATETVDVGNAAPGERICRSLVIDPKDATGGIRSSAETCVVIAKTPYVQFLGNDVWAGGGFPDVNPACNTSAKITTSSHALKDGSVAGSIGEYGAFALGKILNFGSASKAIVNPAASTGKMLTFSNVNNSNLGFYAAAQHCINDYVSTYSGTPITAEPATIDVGSRSSGTWRVSGARTFHGNMPNGSQQIYLVNGDATIDGDLKYSDNYGSLGDIPSLVIIATGNILVRDNVGQMDGLFVAKGTFNTCSNAPSGNLSASNCNVQLNVNGAVVAGSLTLLRTSGADGSNDVDRKKPAEIFNFNAEMYLRSALTSGSSSGTVRVVDEKDLPPRY